MLDYQVVFLVIGKTLVELSILFLGDVIGVSGPNGPSLVQFFLINTFLLNLLSSLFVVLPSIILLI